MTSDEIRDICKQRLGSWTERLVEQHSTPMILIGVGHDHKTGQLLVLTLEDISNSDAAMFLQSALNKLKPGPTMRAR